MAVTDSDKIKLSDEFFGEKTIVLAKSGYGKSYTTRVIIEEGVERGNTFIIIDPQDAYLNLPEFDYIDIDKVKSAKGIAILLAASHKNVVIRMKSLPIKKQNEFLKIFLETFRLNITKGIQTIVIDELHKYAPEGEKADSREVIRGMFQENRSDGLGIIGISQRVSRIDKTCLAQADNLCIGKVTAFRDKQAVQNYIDDPADLEKIKNLEKGEFYFYGFGNNSVEIAKVRKSKSEHSGNSPKNLLNEDDILYSEHINKFYKKRKKGNEKMSDNISDGKGKLSKILPSAEGFKDLAALGAKVSLGMAAGGMVGAYVGSKFKSPIPILSSRTLGSAASTIVLYTGFRMIKQEMAKDILKYSAAGAAVYTAGSLIFDLVVMSKVQLPAFVTSALSMATGVQAAGNAATEDSGVDVNTEFA